MIFGSPQQFGQCSRSRSNTGPSSLARLRRTGRWCARPASHPAGGTACADASACRGTTRSRSRTYQQVARAHSTQETERRVLEAATRLFAEHYYDDVHIEDVARLAGVTTKTVQRRFGGKEGLAQAFLTAAGKHNAELRDRVPTLEAFSRDVLALAESLDLRFIVCGGWNDTEAVSALAGPRMHFVRSVDHSWLFPRCLVVVHHGGAGTTFAAAESGVPSVICSFFADQPVWGSRIAALGTGAHVPFVKLNQRTLRSALQRALDEDTRRKAAELGRKLRDEDGNARALDALEGIIQRGARAA